MRGASRRLETVGGSDGRVTTLGFIKRDNMTLHTCINAE